MPTNKLIKLHRALVMIPIKSKLPLKNLVSSLVFLSKSFYKVIDDQGGSKEEFLTTFHIEGHQGSNNQLIYHALNLRLSLERGTPECPRKCLSSFLPSNLPLQDQNPSI